MKNVNQRRKYSNIKPFNDCCATALHEAKDVYVESLGATVRCGGELDFIKMDRKELANRQIDRNRRKLDQLVEKLKISEMGFVERVERDYQKSLKSPCGSQKDSV